MTFNQIGEMAVDEQTLPVGEEVQVSKGVVVQRRCLLGTLAALVLTRTVPAWGAAGPSLTYEEFLAEVIPVAKRMVADASADGQEAYLKAVAAVAVRMKDVTPPEMRNTGPGNYIGVNPGGDPFNVLHWRMDPGAEIRIHPHIYGNVMTLGLAGAAEVVNYEMEGVRDWTTTAPFRVRRTVRQTLKTGDVNLVNLERNYMHGFRAGPEGARGLDITTRLKERVDSPVLVVKDAEAAQTEARWLYETAGMK
jgi:quercetin dioxygenase-like cupin family protein